METLNYIETTFHEDIGADVLKGLTAPRKSIPSKYLYDARGSAIFEEICRLPEYYPTRTELSILKDAAPAVMERFCGGDIVELGAGSSLKIRTLLGGLPAGRLQGIRYIPVDVSTAALEASACELVDLYPGLELLGIAADFTRHMDMIPASRKRLFVFFGSTIGNFDEDEGAGFLKGIACSMNTGDLLLVGFDMLKPRAVVEQAYNDSAGVTAEFNRNILRVVNRELGADFDLGLFSHRALFNEERGRVEMYLRAEAETVVNIGALGLEVGFEKGEGILTEICRKFTREGIERTALDAGLAVTAWFSDPKGWFSLVIMERRGRQGG